MSTMTEPASRREVGESSRGAQVEVGEIIGGVQAGVGVVTEVVAVVVTEGVAEGVNGIRAGNLREMILVVMTMVILTWSLAQKDHKVDSKCWSFLFQMYHNEYAT
jgi:Ca2+/Na+ antiporter